MKKRFILFSILSIYSGFLIYLLVSKNIELRFGHVRFIFGPEPGDANFVPFKSIWPYLLGEHGWFFALLNLGGNIGLFMPIGFLLSLLSPKMNWQRSLLVGMLLSLVIEGLQAVLRVGIVDIDDVILNSFGALLGYGVYVILLRQKLR